MEEPPDPAVEAWRARKREFDNAGYEGKQDLFLRTVDDPELMDGEMALEMLGDLFAETIRRGERSRFDALLAAPRAAS